MARPRSTPAPSPAAAAPDRAGSRRPAPAPARRPRRGEPDLPPAPARPATGTGRTGFVLYVGVDQDGRAAELTEVAEALRDLAQDLLPAAETFTALALVPAGGPDDVQTLRTRLAALRPLDPHPPAGRGAATG